MMKEGGVTRLRSCLSRRKEAGELCFVSFLTAGYPEQGATVPLLLEMQSSGVDVIELGVPFSDPCADGPVIQKSSLRAVKGGITLSHCLDIVKEARAHHLTLPVLLMTYYNPILQYGLKRICQDASNAGVDGFVVVDLPVEDMVIARGPVLSESESLMYSCKAHDLSIIPLVAPSTRSDRVKKILKVATSFVYVSLTGVTGVRSLDTWRESACNALPILQSLQEEVKGLATPKPLILLGFGVASEDHVNYLAGPTFKGLVDGFIMGSALINAIDNPEPTKSSITQRVGELCKQLSAKRKFHS